jgi:hypothetical protein
MKSFLHSARDRMQSVETLLRNRAPQPSFETEDETLAEFTARAGAAFEKDMQPVCTAIAGALQKGDLNALRDLRALLPHLLLEVNRDPALGDLLAHQLGKTFLDGMTGERENEKPETRNQKPGGAS